MPEDGGKPTCTESQNLRFPGRQRAFGDAQTGSRNWSEVEEILLSVRFDDALGTPG